jgi:hypothetical protein
MGLVPLIIGLVLLFLILMLGKQFTQADVKVLAARLRTVGGGAALIGAAFLFFTGRIAPAIFLATLAYALLNRSGQFPFGWPQNSRKTAGQSSQVRSSHIEMSLDHDTGEMSGRVLRGQFAGQNLVDLSVTQQIGLLAALQQDDPQGAQLLQAYLDKTAPNWVEEAAKAGYSYAGSGNGGNGHAAMSLDEAYRVLGLSPGATRDDVQAAHRNLMKRFHPDQGGSTYLASKINEAKAVLLKSINV